MTDLPARADLARLLSACFYQPAPEFAEERLFDSLHEAAAAIEPQLAERARRLRDAFAATDLQELLVDYTRLFLGPVQALAQPYGSVWLGSGPALMQESTLAVMRLYAQGGFEIDDEFRDVPDHVAVELEFLYLLLFRAAQGADPEANATLRPRLLDEHLGQWIGPFTAAMLKGAQTDFYRELAALTERFVALELSDYAAATARP